jgi:hypothetical protein
MTAFSKVKKGHFSNRNNQKDWGHHAPRPRSQTKEFEANGFEREGWNKWAYTWQDNFPIFTVTPGIATDDTGTHAGLVARYAPADIEIIFPYGTPPKRIAERLNDEILAIMQHDADLDGPPISWEPSVTPPDVGPWIDVDAFMAKVSG